MSDYLDVLCEFDPLELANVHNPMQKIAEVCTATAKELAAQGGHELLDSEPIETTGTELINRKTGASVYGVSTRWRVRR